MAASFQVDGTTINIDAGAGENLAIISNGRVLECRDGAGVVVGSQNMDPEDNGGIEFTGVNINIAGGGGKLTYDMTLGDPFGNHSTTGVPLNNRVFDGGGDATVEVIHQGGSATFTQGDGVFFAPGIELLTYNNLG